MTRRNNEAYRSWHDVQSVLHTPNQALNLWGDHASACMTELQGRSFNAGMNDEYSLNKRVYERVKLSGSVERQGRKETVHAFE